MGPTTRLTVLGAALLILGSAWAQEVIVYPAQGQSGEQTEKDKYECYQWSKDQTGFDPMAPPTATRPPPQEKASQTGGAGSGALKGAAAGAAIGVIRGDTAKWAGRGAATGALVGGARRSNQRNKDNQARQQWEQEQASQYQAARNNYNRAYTACLSGRGYTVN
ncbi:MAG: hypothetical protein PVJ12_09135 [Gammaproteobacteria bacterium]|jgi:uncharacterized membrane protein YebE (DUF533 family)